MKLRCVSVEPQPVVSVCFQGQMSASPDVFAHLTHLLMNLAGGRLCAVLEVGLLDPAALLEESRHVGL